MNQTSNRWFNLMTILFGVSSFSFLAILSFSSTERAGLTHAMQSICARLETDYVRNHEPNVRSFIRSCFQEIPLEVSRAMSGVNGRDSRRALIASVNARLSVLRVSHLAAYAPDETVAMWTGEALNSGARARIVDGEIVITKVLDASPAARAGVRPGDLLIAVDGVPIQDVYDVESISGVWEILRPDETRMYLPIQAEVLQDRIVPHWLPNQETTGVRVLRIPSFLPQAIGSDEWPRIKDEIAEIGKRREKLVIDVRGNPGGSFPAMLRVLGALKCDRSLVGWIYRGTPPERLHNSAADLKSYAMQDALEAEPQLELLESKGAIALVPFQSGPCFDGRLGVLIDQGTGSVAEIFAQALKERPRTTVAGWRSSGHVVMARWFQIAGLSADYAISVPVALYRSAKGEELESRGVSPDQLLTDSLKRWRSSRDPWIADVIRAVSL